MRALINSTVLTKLRKQAISTLTETCIIKRKITTRDEFLSQVSGYDQIASEVACRMIGVGTLTNSTVGLAANQESLMESYRLIVPVGTDLQADDIVVIGGLTYTVVRLLDNLTDQFFAQALISFKTGVDFG